MCRRGLKENASEGLSAGSGLAEPFGSRHRVLFVGDLICPSSSDGNIAAVSLV